MKESIFSRIPMAFQTKSSRCSASYKENELQEKHFDHLNWIKIKSGRAQSTSTHTYTQSFTRSTNVTFEIVGFV